ncbi:hypothetical protein SNEBB_000992 [Seison nebaliae]|nr:hypothetical protein SNEBB_000992 [Seison nebaliae]
MNPSDPDSYNSYEEYEPNYEDSYSYDETDYQSNTTYYPIYWPKNSTMLPTNGIPVLAMSHRIFTYTIGSSHTMRVDLMSGVEPIEYAWLINGRRLDTMTNGNAKIIIKCRIITFENVVQDFAGEYTLTATNSYGTGRISLKIHVIPSDSTYDVIPSDKTKPPIITTLNNLYYVIQGVHVTPIRLHVVQGIIKSTDIKWYFKGKRQLPEGVELSGDCHEIRFSREADESIIGAYKIIVENKYGTATYIFAIQFLPNSLTIINRNDTQLITQNAPLINPTQSIYYVQNEKAFQLRLVIIRGESPFIFEWFHNGVPVMPSGVKIYKSSITIESFNYIHEGTYTLRVVNIYGEDRCTFTLVSKQIGPIPKPMLRTKYLYYRIPTGDKRTIIVHLVGGEKPVKYSWTYTSPNGKIFTNTLPSQNIKITKRSIVIRKATESLQGRYKLTATNRWGSTSIIITIIVYGEKPRLSYETHRVVLNQMTPFPKTVVIQTVSGSLPITYTWKFLNPSSEKALPWPEEYARKHGAVLQLLGNKPQVDGWFLLSARNRFGLDVFKIRVMIRTTVCSWNDKLIKSGTYFDKSVCETRCQCINGEITGCVKKICESLPSDCLKVQHAENGRCCSVCLQRSSTSKKFCYFNKKKYHNGEVFQKSPCSVDCQCLSGKIINCVSLKCSELPNDCIKKVHPKGQCCAQCIERSSIDLPKCYWNKNKYVDGEQFDKSKCEKRCRCRNGKIMECSTVKCPRLSKSCLRPRVLKSQCCPICDEFSTTPTPSCIYKGRLYQERQYVNKSRCEDNCLCLNGKLTQCTKIACGELPKDCLRVQHLPHKCCPTCVEHSTTSSPMCIWGDKIYKPGSIFKKSVCEINCLCTAAGIIESCHKVNCPVITRSCLETRTPPDSCCAECIRHMSNEIVAPEKTCILPDGRVFHEGERFNRKPCWRNCMCSNRQIVGCVREVCPDRYEQNCLVWNYEPNKCCPVCIKFLVKPVPVCHLPKSNVVYQIGQIFNLTECIVNCHCSEAGVIRDCVKIHCGDLPPNCIKSTLADGCCRRCITFATTVRPKLPCTWQGTGKVYKHGISFSPTPCLLNCQCEDGMIQNCRATQCPVLEGNCLKSQILDGQCCPTCVRYALQNVTSCTLFTNEGKQVIRNGETFDKSPCVKNCMCHNGQIWGCMKLTCSPISDNCYESKLLPGACCPICIDKPSDVAKICRTSDNQVFNEGDVFNEGPCRVGCQCHQGKIVNCMTLQCPKISPNCLKAAVQDGECCKRCLIFNHAVIPNDKMYCQVGSRKILNGNIVKRNVCEKNCRCVDGKVINCVRMRCQKLPKDCIKTADSSKKQCCKRCIKLRSSSTGKCEAEGKFFTDGQVFNLNNCITNCHCIKGKVLNCIKLECTPLPDNCLKTSHKKDECCPSCVKVDSSVSTSPNALKKYCYSEDGSKQIADGEKGDRGPCYQNCMCKDGEWVKCTTITCETGVLYDKENKKITGACTRIIRLPDQCCPICVETGMLPKLGMKKLYYIVREGKSLTIPILLIQGSQPMTFQWLFNDKPGLPKNVKKISDLTILITKATPMTAGRYVLRVSNPYGSDSVKVLVHTQPLESPELRIRKRNWLLNIGRPISITVHLLSGTAPIYYTWFFNGKPTLPSGVRVFGRTINILKARPQMSGTYSLKATNSHGSDEISLTITIKGDEPNLSISHKVFYVREHQPLIITVDNSEGSLPDKYVWTFKGRHIDPSPNIKVIDNQLLIRSASKNFEGRYVVTGTNTQGTSRVSFKLVVFDFDYVVPVDKIIAPILTTRRKQLIDVEGSKIIILVKLVSGTNPVKYDWKWNGKPIPPVNVLFDPKMMRVVIYQLERGVNDGVYTLTASNSGGETEIDINVSVRQITSTSATHQPYTVTFSTNPAPTDSLSEIMPSIIFNAKLIRLSYGESKIIPLRIGGKRPFNFIWQFFPNKNNNKEQLPRNIIFKNNALELTDMTLANNGRYILIVTNKHGKASITFDISINKPTVTTPDDRIDYNTEEYIDRSPKITINNREITLRYGTNKIIRPRILNKNDGPFAFVWLFNHHDDLPANVNWSEDSQELQFTSVRPSTSGVYTIRVTNPYGSKELSVYVKVIGQPIQTTQPTTVDPYDSIVAVLHPNGRVFYIDDNRPNEIGLPSFEGITSTSFPIDNFPATGDFTYNLPIIHGLRPIRLNWYFVGQSSEFPPGIKFIRNGTQIQFSHINPDMNGEYVLEIGNGEGRKIVRFIVDIVSGDAPKLGGKIDTHFTLGQSKTIRLEVLKGTLPITYSWSYNGTDTLPANVATRGPMIGFSPITMNNVGVYRLVAQNKFGRSIANIEAFVTSIVPEISFPENSFKLFLYSRRVKLTIPKPNIQGLKVSWKKANGKRLPKGMSVKPYGLYITKVSYRMSGKYVMTMATKDWKKSFTFSISVQRRRNNKKCKVNKKSYLNGKMFDKDKCTRCMCFNGQAINCIRKKCPILPWYCEKQQIPKNECCPVCDMSNENLYKGK